MYIVNSGELKLTKRLAGDKSDEERARTWIVEVFNMLGNDAALSLLPADADPELGRIDLGC